MTNAFSRLSRVTMTSLMAALMIASPLALDWPARAADRVQAVIMKSISYDPKTLEIEAGDAVEWTNKSYTEHSASAEDSSFDTGLIPPGKTTKQVTFSSPGIFTYHCSMHGKSMTGIIKVKAKPK